MEYRRAGNKIIAVLERGEELCAALRALAADEGIRFALVSAHGSCGSVRLGSYDRRGGRLMIERYSDIACDFELASVTGELIGGDEPALSLHAVIGSVIKGDEFGSRFGDRHIGIVYAGTLESAEVSAGCTAVLELLELDARLAGVPAPESGDGGILGKIGRTFAKTDGFDPPYRRLELE